MPRVLHLDVVPVTVQAWARSQQRLLSLSSKVLAISYNLRSTIKDGSHDPNLRLSGYVDPLWLYLNTGQFTIGHQSIEDPKRWIHRMRHRR
jgi:hypothetical protein